MRRRPGIPDPVFERADAPTLAMSSVPVDVARLRQLLDFEQTLRRLAPAGSTSEQTARAHAAALLASGISASEVEAPLALLRRYAANRSLVARLVERLEGLSARSKIEPAAAEQAGEVRRRLSELDDALEAREDASTRRVLESHAAEILALFAGPPASKG